jgi:hypothetical protein
MDSGISTVRNLLYIVLVLAVLSLCACAYLGTQLSTNSAELDRLGVLLQKQLMTTGIEQSQQLQQKLDVAHQYAESIDGKLKKAQDDFVVRMNREVPGLVERSMDSYIKKHAPQIERQVMKQVPQ